MATQMVRQTMFVNGEVDIVTWKRTDNAEAYISSAQSMLNAETGTTGLAKKRRGTKVLFDVSDVDTILSTSRMYEFADQNGIYYIVFAYNLAFNIYQINPNDGSLSFYQTVVTPYARQDIPDLDYTLDNDVLIFTHNLYPVARLYISTYVPFATFAYQVLAISPLPSFDFGDINYNSATVTPIGGPTGAVGTSITLRFSVDFGGLVAAQAWVGGQIIAAGTNVTSPVGYYIISSVTQAGGAGTIDFIGIVRVAIGIPVSTNGDQYSVRKPVFLAGSDTFNRGYPAKTIFYQNRLWLANTPLLPTTLMGSKINAPVNFDVGTGADTDAIIYTLGQTNTGAIQWLNGGKQLEVFTDNYEFVCPQDQNSGLTPGTFAIRQQSSYGASINVKPITYINDSYYVNKSQNSIINFHFNGVGLAYESKNLSILSSHLVKHPQNRAIQRGSSNSQDNFIYFLNNDGQMTSFQFSLESNLAALTPIQFQLDADDLPLAQVIDIVTVNNTIYLLKKLNSGVVPFFIEQFDDVQRIDSYTENTMQADGTVTGLDDYEGLTVQVIFNNQDFGQYLVTGGQITVFDPQGLTGTVLIGLLYPVNITPMYLFGGALQSNYFKQITTIFTDYYNSLDFYVNGTLINFQNFSAIQAGLPLSPQTGTAINYPVNGWDRFQTFSITQNSPFDLQILGIAYQIDAQIL